MSFRIAAVAAGCLLIAGVAEAQSSPGSQTTPSATTPDADYRPAANTFFGDTGLWFVPTAEVLPDGKWSGAVYRRGTNYIEGYTNVADFAGTFAYGIKGRAEIFGSLLVDTRIARNLKPVFITDPSTGGVVAAYPQVNQNWTGDNFGDFYIGAKVNLWSQATPKPAAMAVRVIVKLPTGNTNAGVSTGKADFFGDFIVSKEIAEKAEVSGYAGLGYLGSPDNFSTPTGVFRWGVGAQWPSRSALRGDFELNGNAYTSSGVVITGPPVVGVDGSISPLTASTENLTRATAALTWQMKHGAYGRDARRGEHCQYGRVAEVGRRERAASPTARHLPEPQPRGTFHAFSLRRIRNVLAARVRAVVAAGWLRTVAARRGSCHHTSGRLL
jgi:hypothetical protein